MRILQRNLKRTTDTFLFISHTTNVLLFKFRYNILIGVRILKEIPGSVASRTHCITRRICIVCWITEATILHSEYVIFIDFSTAIMVARRRLCVALYTGCPRRNVPDFGSMFLMLKYTDITQNTYIQS